VIASGSLRQLPSWYMSRGEGVPPLPRSTDEVPLRGQAGRGDADRRDRGAARIGLLIVMTLLLILFLAAATAGGIGILKTRAQFTVGYSGLVVLEVFLMFGVGHTARRILSLLGQSLLRGIDDSDDSDGSDDSRSGDDRVL
jgi:hypothetical protein